jgi:hypothetical protein
MNWQDYIEEQPGVMTGKPVFKGTRITVEHVLRELGGGTTEGNLLEAHPRLTACQPCEWGTGRRTTDLRRAWRTARARRSVLPG